MYTPASDADGIAPACRCGRVTREIHGLTRVQEGSGIMRVQVDRWDGARAAESTREGERLVLAFGARASLTSEWDALAAAHPGAALLGCSTAGEIMGTSVRDGTIALARVDLDRTSVRTASAFIDGDGSKLAGERLAEQLVAPDLQYVFVLSDGLRANGSELVRGLTSKLGAGVTLTGGLAGDAAAFEETVVGVGSQLASGQVGAVGFYGDRLRVSTGSLGGWDSFGPERRVTRAVGNVVYEFDGQPALSLYKRYLGDHAAALPASALLFPLSVRAEGSDQSVVRTILAVDEAAQSMTFAGDIAQGALARLMKANFDRLVDGAVGAATAALEPLAPGDQPEFAILISCVGRKLVLQQRIEEEVEGVRSVLGATTPMVGFYSYGEISPVIEEARCELHNQTMTITTLSEAA
jgi:hypothetical protein